MLMILTLSLALNLISQPVPQTTHAKLEVIKIWETQTGDVYTPQSETVCTVEANIPVYTTGDGLIPYTADLPQCLFNLPDTQNGAKKNVLLKTRGRVLIRNDQPELPTLKYFLASVAILDETGKKAVREPVTFSAATKPETDYLMIDQSSTTYPKNGYTLAMQISFAD